MSEKSDELLAFEAMLDDLPRPVLNTDELREIRVYRDNSGGEITEVRTCLDWQGGQSKYIGSKLVKARGQLITVPFPLKGARNLEEAIKKYMESLIPLVERGGYIPFCDHRCPPDVTYENYLYYFDLKEAMFGMK